MQNEHQGGCLPMTTVFFSSAWFKEISCKQSRRNFKGKWEINLFPYYWGRANILTTIYFQRCVHRFDQILFLGLFIYFKRDRAHVREGQRERESQAGSPLSAQCLMRGFNVTNCKIVIWVEIKSQTINLLSHPGAPRFDQILKIVSSVHK